MADLETRALYRETANLKKRIVGQIKTSTKEFRELREYLRDLKREAKELRVKLRELKKDIQPVDAESVTA